MTDRWQTFYERMEDRRPRMTLAASVGLGVILLGCLMAWAVFICMMLDAMVN